MPTEVGGSGGMGTGVQPGAQGSVFDTLRLVVRSQANALVDPSDAPSLPAGVAEFRVATDAGGNVALYVFVPGIGWTGVQTS